MRIMKFYRRNRGLNGSKITLVPKKNGDVGVKIKVYR